MWVLCGCDVHGVCVEYGTHLLAYVFCYAYMCVHACMHYDQVHSYKHGYVQM